MNDIFHEQLVKRKTTSKSVATKVITLVICLLVIFITLYSEVLFFFIVPILLVEIAVIIFIFRRQNVEFEYIVTNSELDIDKITAMTKRKHLYTIELKSVTSIAKYSEISQFSQFKSVSKTIDVSSGEMSDNTYAMITTIAKKPAMVIFEPNEDIFKALKLYLRGKIL